MTSFLWMLLLWLSLSKCAESFYPQWKTSHPELPRFGSLNTNKQKLATTSSLRVLLPTNVEFLADERYETEPAYRSIQWMDPARESTNGEKNDNHDVYNLEEEETIPIYPIPAVYLPFTHHTLNNVEPRNLQMALDLNQTDSNKLFCVTLRATDTGRISRKATLLRMIDMEPTFRQDSAREPVLSRITVSCEAVGIVDIVSIENPQAASPLARLQRSDEYLRGRVVPVTEKNDETDALSLTTIQQSVQTDLALIKSMYQRGIGSRGTLSVTALQDLAHAIPISDKKTTVWAVAQLWQSVCDTVRVGRQFTLGGDRNEFLVDAACRKGGPLKLPVHPEELEPADRTQLAQWERAVQRAFHDTIQLDPCLDFLPLLGMESDKDRWQWLAKLISRERQRLERAADADFDDEVPSLRPSRVAMEEPVRKGAWFDDGVW